MNMANWLRKIFLAKTLHDQDDLPISVNESFTKPTRANPAYLHNQMTSAEDSFRKSGIKIINPELQDVSRISFYLGHHDIIVELQKPKSMTAMAYLIKLNLEENGDFDLKAFSKRIAADLHEIGFTFEHPVDALVGIETLARTWNAENGHLPYINAPSNNP